MKRSETAGPEHWTTFAGFERRAGSASHEGAPVRPIGPASQHQNMDRFAERYGLVDTGRVFTVAHSGKDRLAVRRWQRCSRSSGRQFDILLTGYFDRGSEPSPTLECRGRQLHPSGVSWVMCDRSLVSSDPNHWDQMISEAHESERYSRHLGERSQTVRVEVPGSWRPGRPAGLGFQAAGHPPSSSRIPRQSAFAVAMFERYATGTISMEALAEEFAMTEGAVAMILRNPIYNGWVHRFVALEEPTPAAAWRTNPPVSDTLWQRVEEIRVVAGRCTAVRGNPTLRICCGASSSACVERGSRARNDGNTATQAESPSAAPALH